MQSVIKYVIPMEVWLFSHFKVSKDFLENKKTVSNNLSDEERLKKHRKIEQVT